MKNVYIYLFDGFADWEIGFLTPELKKNTDINLFTVSNNNQPIVSLGGLKIIPNTSLHEIDPDNITMFILPGGSFWEHNLNETKLDSLLTKINLNNSAIAAICGATIYLGHKGYLNNIEHTSNDLNYLKAAATEYAGEVYYNNELAVNHNNIITAKGIAPIEFTKNILEQLNFETNYIKKWFQLFKYGIWTE